MSFTKETHIKAENIPEGVENNYLLAVIPFQGFYDSVHDHIINLELEQEVERLQEEYEITDDQAMDFCDSFSYNSEVLRMYCTEYLKLLSVDLDLMYPFIFECLTSPEFYNFSTDRIFAYIHKEDVKHMYSTTNRSQSLQRVAKDRFTSYDGFISSYSADVDDWEQDVMQWDHHQLDALIQAYVDDTLADDWEHYIMDNSDKIGELIYIGISQEQRDLVNKITGW